jgi:acyl-CoA thioesterase-1
LEEETMSKPYSLFAAFALVSIVTMNTFAQEAAFAEVEDAPNLPRVLLIGDSISIGYTVAVREELDGAANVHRIPTNGGPTFRGLERINEWLGKSKWDVIHFNWGLHDLKFMPDDHHQVILEQYKLNLERLVGILEQTGAKLIWCNTTPVVDGVSPKRIPDDVVMYNEVAAEIMKKHNIAVNDLYSFALKQLAAIQQPVNVHFTEEGSKILGKEVAEQIQKQLK